MDEPVKKRLIGALVVAIIGAIVLSFVLHDAHPTYKEVAKPSLKHSSLMPEQVKKTDQTRWLALPRHTLAQSQFQGKSEQITQDQPMASCEYDPKASQNRVQCNSEKREIAPDNSPFLSPQPHIRDQISKKKGSKSSRLLKQTKEKRHAQSKFDAHWVLRLASFRDKHNAISLKDSLVKQGLPANMFVYHHAGVPYYRVSLGPSTHQAVMRWKQVLEKTRRLRAYIVKK